MNDGQFVGIAMILTGMSLGICICIAASAEQIAKAIRETRK